VLPTLDALHKEAIQISGPEQLARFISLPLCCLKLLFLVAKTWQVVTIAMRRNGRTVALVIGGSRGIGRQVAIDLAQNGYYVVVAAKSTSDAHKADPFPPDPNSPQSTINTVAREIREAGGDALALPVDVRDFESIKTLIDETVGQLGSLDVLVYNSGAIWWASVEDTPMKRFQLMQKINPEGLSIVWLS
jgi:NAD(P)-dependent dehydrogenase (short-subunit alcohol dehydrogenase family)